jgi:hypothetical protein
MLVEGLADFVKQRNFFYFFHISSKLENFWRLLAQRRLNRQSERSKKDRNPYRADSPPLEFGARRRVAVGSFKNGSQQN